MDLYSENASKCRPQVGVPANGQGEQTAFNGGSYAGFIAYRDEPVLRGLPEGIGGPLTTYESGYLEYSEYLRNLHCQWGGEVLDYRSVRLEEDEGIRCCRRTMAETPTSILLRRWDEHHAG